MSKIDSDATPAGHPAAPARGGQAGLAEEDRALVPVAPLPKAIAMIIMVAATMLVALDQTIATVALPHMQAALGATPESINWVLTSYIIATAVGAPMTAWLAGRLGRRRMFGACVLGFTLASMLCGIAITLPMMVAARLFQGFFGAFIIPMAHAFMYDMNPPSRQVRAITIWGFATMLGPILGPVVGGWVTDAFNWRWVFFLNVPIGIVALIGIFIALPDFPSPRRVFDHVGFAMIVVALCGLQLALDRGTQQDWFESPEILVEFAISISAFWMLIFHLGRSPTPIISVSLFANRTFTSAITISAIVVPIIVAANALLPSLLVILLGYPVYLAGVALIPRGVALAVAILIGGQMMRRIDGRYQLSIGMMLVIASLAVQTGFSVQMDWTTVFWSGVLQGLGTGLMMTVLNFAVVASVPAALRTEAAALSALFRNVGTSLAIAVFTALLARNIQINHAEIGAMLGSNGTPLAMLKALSRVNIAEQAAALANAEVTRQAMMVAYIDNFWAMMWTVVCLLPILLLMKPISAKGAKAEPAGLE
ncbi:DHA2 family efflux MFS transporter permease subunit [Rhizorhabdus argentea]|uniref:DHA2 family efflux MFS transporter permease subunit n=1 Tax=Rhizorhabdus argentea TaxID=1387174 RepID=UPI0030EDB0EE